MAQTDIIIDPWTNLSHKRGLDGERSNLPLAHTWVGKVGGQTWRRLAAYKALRLYLENAARHLLNTDSEKTRREHREYGDPFIIAEAIRAAVVGDAIEVVVDGAADDPDAEDADTAAIEATQAREEDLRDWASPNVERLAMRVIEAERHACGVGDAVYLISWSAKRQRPRLRVFDPGFYFPVLDPSRDDEFPERVHLAWEWEDDNGDRWVRRITWELAQIGYAGQPPQVGSTPRAEIAETSRTLPWHVEERGTWTNEVTTTTCYMSDAVWRAEDVIEGQVNGVDSFPIGKVHHWTRDDEGEVIGRDLMVNFIPLIHLPNTIAGVEHFGRSTIANVVQIFDDIAAADTDLSKSAAIAGTPPIAIEAGDGYVDQPESTTSDGTQNERFSNRPSRGVRSYGPGTVYPGKVTVVDTSKSLQPLIEFGTHLLKRLSVNARTPEEILGRVKASDVASGILFSLAFGPFRAMVDEMRLVREQKGGLLLKIVQRLMILGKMTDDPRVYNANIALGAYLPTDLTGVVDMIVNLLREHGISRRTALHLMVEAGLDLDGTIEQEVQAIQSEDFAGAGDLVDATDDLQAARDYLGLEGAPPEPDPAAAAEPAPVDGVPPVPKVEPPA